MGPQSSPEFLALQQVVAGRYSLERELGRGGMGIVFLVRDVALDRPVSIKLLPPALAALPELKQRFLREARTAAKLSHPNIVPVYSVEERDHLVFYAMGYVDGQSLGQRVRRGGPLSPSAVIRLVQEVAWALAYAHGRGVIHRDVKPDNILLEKGSGRAMVTDFGIARVVDQTGVTARGEILGTAHYMSPEQASGEATDGRSDLYSLGVTAYFALTGTLPFDGPSLPAILARVVTEPAPKVAAQRKDAPPRLAEAIDRCLAKTPSQRFASGEELAEAVGAAHHVIREAPPQIRHLIRVARELDIWFGVLFLLLYLMPIVVEALWPAGLMSLIVLTLVVGTQILSGPISLFTAIRRVVKAGLGMEDVRVALEHAIRARVEEEQLVSGSGQPPRARQRAWAVAGAGLVIAGAGTLLAAKQLGLAAGGDAGAVLIAVGTVALVGAFAMSALAEGDTTRRRRALGIGLRLLEGPLGRWLFRVAGLGLDVEQQNAPPATEHTELLLGNAAEALFKALPTNIRKRFPDAPNAIERLERDAGLLRERERALSQALAQAQPDRAPDTPGGRREATVAELMQARETARERLATAVAALENIRLDLLRLQAGVGSADDLTADLEQAREINQAVSAELAGRAEVERLTGT